MELVASLRSFGRHDLAAAGGKGANLGELLRAGFPVPDGFVITTEAYALVVAATSADLLAEAQVPDSLREAILGAYAELGGGPVAVRSSATAEDLPGAAFAGQQDTFLNVVGEEELLDAVRRCWASLWGERAVAYRERLGIDPAEVRIAVVVQAMVEADMAGVLFTADPVTGDRGRTVVDASDGLGEAVVSGLVTPDHYVIEGERVVEHVRGRREVVIRGTAGGGTTTTAQETSADAHGRSELPPEALRELVALGARAARHFGRPQDIEWATKAARVHLLQARPMTALPPPPLARKLNPIERRIGGVLLEYLPVRPYPIDVTTWLPYGPAGMMGDIAQYFGIKVPSRASSKNRTASSTA